MGGMWYWNRYPGARGDSESHSYAYYFSRELPEEWEWTERYPGQVEILDYLNQVADRFDLRRDIHFSASVARSTYLEDVNLWCVETEAGDRYLATYLVLAVGCPSTANVPDIPGLDRFEGECYHTGRWSHEGVDLRGKPVAQIGTESAGIQVAPVIPERRNTSRCSNGRATCRWRSNSMRSGSWAASR